MRILAHRSMAAPFVFKPFHTRTREELVDLVWAGNNCVIFMPMTRNKKYDNVERNRRKKKKAIEHNLNQASWALKEWRNDQTSLMGSSQWCKFSLRYRSGIGILVLSVIQCGEAVAVVHDDVAMKWRIDCCATLPYSVIEWLVNSGCSIPDLMSILIGFRGEGEIPENLALDAAIRYVVGNWKLAGEASVQDNVGIVADEVFHEALNMLLAMRQQLVVLPVQPVQEVVDLRSILSDMPLMLLLKLACELQRAIKNSRDIPAKQGWLAIRIVNLDLGQWKCGICTIPRLAEMNEIAVQTVNSWFRERQAESSRFSFMIIYACDLRQAMLRCSTTAGPTIAQYMLNASLRPIVYRDS